MEAGEENTEKADVRQILDSAVSNMATRWQY